MVIGITCHLSRMLQTDQHGLIARLRICFQGLTGKGDYPYLKLPFHEWPWERKFAKRKMTEVVPREELNAKYRGFSGVAKKVKKKGDDDIIFKTLEGGFTTNGYSELIDRTEPWFRKLAKIRAEKKPGFLTLTSRELAMRYWYKVSMGAGHHTGTGSRQTERANFGRI